MEKAGLNVKDYEFLDEQGSRSTVEDSQPVAENGQSIAMMHQMMLQMKGQVD
ncbi:GL21452 [Drosophila persimilis]|uniref:GL21452 n=1 Tax=Drosophila persimilis TaxID=7234 RepID=B4IRV5_DROPE|nr:GL22424 [Drosophila persimilis]EDW39427.1 GL21452 [Drosophila persimilis]